MTTIKCNGIKVPTNFNLPLTDNMRRWIEIGRKVFGDLHPVNEWGIGGKYLRGRRFDSDQDVVTRIVSACPTISDFQIDREQWILAALDDCAQADHRYQFEKDYGSEKQDRAMEADAFPEK